MTDKSNTLELEVIRHVFGIAPGPQYDPLYISLHETDPTEAGDQTSGETDYGNYARQAVASSAWTDNGDGSVQNTNQILFPASSDGPHNINFVGVGSALTGTGKLLYFKTVTQLIVNPGVEPKFDPGQLLVAEL